MPNAIRFFRQTTREQLNPESMRREMQQRLGIDAKQTGGILNLVSHALMFFPTTDVDKEFDSLCDIFGRHLAKSWRDDEATTYFHALRTIGWIRSELLFVSCWAAEDGELNELADEQADAFAAGK